MARAPTLSSVVSDLKHHIDDCMSLRKETAGAMRDMSAGLEKLSDKFAMIDSLFTWARRGIGAIVVAVLAAGASVLVQNYLQHQQTQATAVTAAQAADSSAATAEVINKKLDALIAVHGQPSP
jgi:hypothetical protein